MDCPASVGSFESEGPTGARQALILPRIEDSEADWFADDGIGFGQDLFGELHGGLADLVCRHHDGGGAVGKLLLVDRALKWGQPNVS